MAIKAIHNTSEKTWFITFTCFHWMPLFEITNSHDLVYNWFRLIKSKYNTSVVAFVIMPNHIHCILQLNEKVDLNKILSNAKRFMAYEIIKRLKEKNEINILTKLSNACSSEDKNKGQKHRVFEPSFDAKPIFTNKFLHQKIDYIHFNPVSGKWNLATEFTDYHHSSASFYETSAVHPEVEILHYLDLEN